MQYLLPFDGMRQADLLIALIARVGDILPAADDIAAILAAKGPVLTALPSIEGRPSGMLLAPGLYRIRGRIVDTRRWPEASRRLMMARLPADGAPVSLYLTATWRNRYWSAEDGDIDPGAAPAEPMSTFERPLNEVRLVTEEPVLRIIPCTEWDADGALFVGQMTLSKHGAYLLDPAVLPPVATMAYAPAVGDAILAWLEPLLARAVSLEKSSCSNACGVEQANRQKAALAGAWAVRTRYAVSLASAVPLERLLAALRADLDQLLRSLGAAGLPATVAHEAEGVGFKLHHWLPTVEAKQEMDGLERALEDGSRPGLEGLVLGPDALAVSISTDGKMSIQATLGTSLASRLGLTKPPRALDIRVEPLDAGHALRATGSALVHPSLPANRLPVFLGRVPIETDIRGRLLLNVQIGAHEQVPAFNAEVAAIFDSSKFRLELDAAPEGTPPQVPVPLKLIIIPIN